MKFSKLILPLRHLQSVFFLWSRSLVQQTKMSADRLPSERLLVLLRNCSCVIYSLNNSLN